MLRTGRKVHVQAAGPTRERTVTLYVKTKQRGSSPGQLPQAMVHPRPREEHLPRCSIDPRKGMVGLPVRTYHDTFQQQMPLPSTKTTLPEELPTSQRYPEGACTTVAINAYERSEDARLACIKRHGTLCAVCKFDFATLYGELGRGFIHVHHNIPLAQIGGNHQVNPITDLTPVCPDCHAMLHHNRDNPLSIDQLRAIIRHQRSVAGLSEDPHADSARHPRSQ